MIPPNRIRPIVGFVLLALLASCFGDGARSDQAEPKTRASDPPLTHSWTMSVPVGPVTQAWLGTNPDTLADAMMSDGTLPGIVNRIAAQCDEVLPSSGAIALRFAIAEGGALRGVEADPPAPAGTCLAKHLQSEQDALKSFPAGIALLRLRLNP